MRASAWPVDVFLQRCLNKLISLGLVQFGVRRAEDGEANGPTPRTRTVENPLKKRSRHTVCKEHYTSMAFNLDSKTSASNCRDWVNNKSSCRDESATDWSSSSMPDLFKSLLLSTEMDVS